MKFLLAVGIVVLVAGLVAAWIVVDPLDNGTEPAIDTHLTGTACERLAQLAGNLAQTDDSADDFLLDLGKDAAGIREGRGALVDLAHGGRNLIPGKGFKARFDDGSIGQVRHFAGYARAEMFGGADVTRWIGSNLRSDRPDSPDGRLGDQGIDFAQELLAGRLGLFEASSWIRTRLCRVAPAGESG